jgi:dihydroneopterin aldolase/D-erythro-7,8-dihydroneopterin triphosphate epimerase
MVSRDEGMSYDFMDKIFIDDLLMRCIIGIFPDERIHKQDVIVSLCLYTDTRPAAMSESIDDTISYKDIQEEIMAMVENSSFQLVETMAAAVADICLSRKGVEAVRVRVDKPSALRFCRSVGVEIFRTSDSASLTQEAGS